MPSSHSRSMYKTAHRWFAVGVCSAFAFVFGFTFASLLVMALLGAILGPLPDSDQHLPLVKHRHATHKFSFAFLICIPFTLLAIYGGWFINAIINMEIFSTSVTNIDGVYIPSAFLKFIKGDIIGFSFDPFFLTYITLFIGTITHIALDIITPSGLEFFGHKLSGGILSNNPKINKLFIFIGVFLFVASVSICLVSMTLEVSFFGSIIIVIIIIVIGLVFFISIFKKQKRFTDQIKCFNVDGERFCTRKDCVIVKGKKTCVTEKD